MDANGRHIMINCDGVGKEPPVSEVSFCEFLARRVMVVVQITGKVTGDDIGYLIQSYEKGVR